jgi:hypothetical protein
MAGCNDTPKITMALFLKPATSRDMERVTAITTYSGSAAVLNIERFDECVLPSFNIGD